MTSEHRYFTTPIFYATGEPHAGHLYTTTLLNILKNHYTNRGMQTLSLTGMDEHGEKIAEKAKSLGVTPQQLVDSLAVSWKNTFDAFGLKSDIFMRTTDASHKRNVQAILQKCYDKGDIYFGEHEGYYCVDCEAFLTSKEMDESHHCLVHKRATELRKEGNYYFRTHKYTAQIIELVRQGQILSQKRYANELIAMAEALDSDLSISRPRTRTEWGIELPFDKKHVTYVWFEALLNYISGIGGIEEAQTNPFWAKATHIIGKDILKFHALFWPAILLSLGLPLPRLLVTGWLLADGHKMSKSLGNVIGLDDLAPYGRDAFTNTVFRLINPGDDLDLSIKLLLERFNADLANGIGNLLARTLGMIEKYFAKALPRFAPEAQTTAEEKLLAQSALALVTEVESAFDAYRVGDALNHISALISKADKYISDQKPWELAKDQSPSGQVRLANVLAHAVGILRCVGFVAHAFFPEKMTELLESLGESTATLADAHVRARRFQDIKVGHTFGDIPKLYQRVDVAAELAKRTPSETSALSAPPASPAPKSDKSLPAHISIDDFSKVEIRVGTVLKAELVEGSDKLLRLQVSLGELGLRQIFSGIRMWVKPESIVNRKVLVVANLAPRKMKFGMSEGMVLSSETTTAGEISPIYINEDIAEGSRLS